jgi:hypothetical protein
MLARFLGGDADLLAVTADDLRRFRLTCWSTAPPRPRPSGLPLAAAALARAPGTGSLTRRRWPPCGHRRCRSCRCRWCRWRTCGNCSRHARAVVSSTCATPRWSGSVGAGGMRRAEAVGLTPRLGRPSIATWWSSWAKGDGRGASHTGTAPGRRAHPLPSGRAPGTHTRSAPTRCGSRRKAHSPTTARADVGTPLRSSGHRPGQAAPTTPHERGHVVGRVRWRRDQRDALVWLEKPTDVVPLRRVQRRRASASPRHASSGLGTGCDSGRGCRDSSAVRQPENGTASATSTRSVTGCCSCRMVT